ncbi:MAG: glycine cleavage system protein GcvH [Candidatus Margulisbacteria bacterium]|nr:glycine cleavage system protein GcvH [Candidatus Margulisiibacteriota bacterium]MBU1616686.1 glycine cleavage system protein GcvH [Candidatus Margulisiibacteriota bacterium]MBU1867133.1 glycine cleavage system protein GcvH [Candidatus Margulisiibacteriota bacterium]
MNFPDNLKYTKEHEWAKADGGHIIIGITDFAQDSLGDVVYVELPQVGKELVAGKEFGVVESVKSVSSLFAPITGTVVEANPALEGNPALVNKSPYADGWIIKVKPNDPASLDSLLSAADYQKTLS